MITLFSGRLLYLCWGGGGWCWAIFLSMNFFSIRLCRNSFPFATCRYVSFTWLALHSTLWDLFCAGVFLGAVMMNYEKDIYKRKGWAVQMILYTKVHSFLVTSHLIIGLYNFSLRWGSNPTQTFPSTLPQPPQGE